MAGSPVSDQKPRVLSLDTFAQDPKAHIGRQYLDGEPIEIQAGYASTLAVILPAHLYHEMKGKLRRVKDLVNGDF